MSARLVSAHNELVHRDLVEFAYQEMLAIEGTHQYTDPLPRGTLLPPEGVDAQEWAAFLKQVAAAPAKFRARSSDLAKVAPPQTNTCSQEIYNDRQLPTRGWDKRLGEVPYPVSIDFAGSGNCGVDFNATPGGMFEPTEPQFDPQRLDQTGIVLGFWAAHVDRQFDDTHLWFRPTSALGGAPTHTRRTRTQRPVPPDAR